MRKKYSWSLPLISLAASVWAGEPPSEPILRINTAMHTALIRAAAVNGKESLLLTASEDKTAKVWDLATGNLLRTLRIPIGKTANEGRLSAAAMAKGGEWVAVGGWTGYEWDKNISIYLLNPQTGELLQRLTGLPNVILNLCLSPDGSRLAATLGGANGVRQWRTKDWQLIASDEDYGGASYGCAYTQDQRLLTTSLDGFLRLYAPDGSLVKKIPAPDGKLPQQIAIDPKEKHFAVGYYENTRLSIGTLSPFKITAKKDNSDLYGGSLSRVAWGKRGLFAGGRYDDGSGISPVIFWNQQGKRQILSGNNNTISSLLPLRTGEILSTAGDPAWLIQNQQGKIQQNHPAAIVDNRGKLRADWQINEEGTKLYFGLEQGAKQSVVFDLSQRTLTPVSAPPAGLHSANTDRLNLTWEDTETPTLNGKPLPLDNQYETSRSVAITKTGESFALGTNWKIYRFNAQGEKQWAKSVPFDAWGVQLSADESLLLAAISDGTFRWYRYADGEELLALFIDKNTLEWVAWTPQGYFDASANGDKLIGWHVNRGADQAPDFFPADKFRSQFYRPAVIQNILKTRDLEEAIALAKEEGEEINSAATIANSLPPVVELPAVTGNIQTGKTELALTVNIRSENSNLKYLKITSDGVTLLEQPISGTGGNYPLTVTIPPRNQLLSIFAVNENGASVPVSRFVQWTGKKENPALDVNKPTLYVLAFGAGEFADSEIPPLHYTVNDAEAFANFMENQRGLYRDVEVKLLKNPTSAQVLDGLDWLTKEVTNQDVAMVFAATHGVKDEQSGEYFLLTQDTDHQRLRRSAVPAKELKITLKNLAGKRLAFLDACYSGDLWNEGKRGLSNMINIDQVANDLAAVENGVIVLTSSTGRQLSQENAAWQHGAFTKALLEGLSGKADYQRKKTITVQNLSAYIAGRVKELTGNDQTPKLITPDGVAHDFPIAIVK